MARSGLLVAAFAAAGSCVSAETLDEVNAIAAAVARVRTEKARFETEWRWQREALEASLEAVERQRELLEHEAEVRKINAEVQDSEIAELVARADAGRAMFDDVDRRLRALSEQVVAMQPWLPPRLAQAVELACRTLADPELPAAERMRHLATVWTRCLQFNRSITRSEEPLMAGASDHPRVMEVVYWGLSHAYALDRGNGTAFHGYPAQEGWRWEERPEIAPRVERLVAIYNDRAEPELVSLPAQVTDPFGKREAVVAADAPAREKLPLGRYQLRVGDAP